MLGGHHAALREFPEGCEGLRRNLLEALRRHLKPLHTSGSRLVAMQSLGTFGRMSYQSSLGLLRLHQRDARIDARERFATRVASRVGPDLVALSTGHRVGCYVAIPTGVDELAPMRERVLGPDAEPVTAIEETGEAAVRHLFRAAMGLHSVVRGEGSSLAGRQRGGGPTLR
jgi:Glutamyl-tRNAGlu reductase, N-terminal domain